MKGLYYKFIRPLIKKIYYSVLGICLKILSFVLFWIRSKPIEPKEINKIILIKLERIGDLVLSQPAIAAIKKRFPQSHITMIVNSSAKAIIENDPHLNEVLVYDAKNIKNKKELVKELQSNKFDLAIDLTARDFFFLPAWLLFLSRAKVILGLDNYGRGFLFNIKAKPYKEPRPLAEEILHILSPLGITGSDFGPRLFLSNEDRDYIQGYLKNKAIKKDDLFICLHMGGTYQTQCWIKQGYAQVAQHLINKYKAKVFFVGIQQEQELIDEVINLMKDEAFNLGGKLSLGQLMALVSRCSLFIGGSSGPLHIAVGFNIPSISIMGPTVYQRWSPQGDKHIVLRRNLPCSSCGLDYCWKGDFACMNQIKPQEVVEAVDKQLSKDNA